jgi:hypothetical protein
MLGRPLVLAQVGGAKLAVVALADDVAMLMSWLRHDFLVVYGPCDNKRSGLYDVVVAGLKI